MVTTLGRTEVVDGTIVRAYPSVSVIVPARDAERTLGPQLEALAGQRYGGEWEVVVADNGSVDRTREVAARWEHVLPDLRVLDASERRGASHARNRGGEVARGEVLLFCDADDVVAPGWVAAMADASVTADLMGGRIDYLALNDAEVVSWRDAADRTELPRPSGFLPYAVSANCGVRADVFRDLGGFREEFFHGGDDVEFFWRGQLAGHELRYVPDAVVRYRYRADLGRMARQYLEFGMAWPAVYRLFRENGFARRPLGSAVRTWGWIALHTPDLLRSRMRRGTWLRIASLAAGRAVGSVKHRTLYL